jgi:hypothetical protein
MFGFCPSSPITITCLDFAHRPVLPWYVQILPIVRYYHYMFGFFQRPVLPSHVWILSTVRHYHHMFGFCPSSGITITCLDYVHRFWIFSIVQCLLFRVFHPLCVYAYSNRNSLCSAVTVSVYCPMFKVLKETSLRLCVFKHWKMDKVRIPYTSKLIFSLTRLSKTRDINCREPLYFSCFLLNIHSTEKF